MSSSAWFSLEGGNRSHSSFVVIVCFCCFLFTPQVSELIGTYVFNAGSSSARDQWIDVLKDLIASGSKLAQGEDELIYGELVKCDIKGKSWKNRW